MLPSLETFFKPFLVLREQKGGYGQTGYVTRLFATKVTQRDTFLGNLIEAFSPLYNPHHLAS